MDHLQVDIIFRIQGFQRELFDLHITLPGLIRLEEGFKGKGGVEKLVIHKAAGSQPERFRDIHLVAVQQFFAFFQIIGDRFREPAQRHLRVAGPSGAQDPGAHDGCFQTDGGIVDHGEFGGLDQLVGADVFFRRDVHHVGKPGELVFLHPIRDGLVAFLPGPGLIRMGPDHKKRIDMVFDDPFDFIQPGKHIIKNHVGVFLTGIKDHIREHRDDLTEGPGFLPEFRRQGLHLRPELHTGGGEGTLHAFGEIVVQLRIPFRGHFKIVRQVDGAGRGFPFGEDGGVRHQADLVGEGRNTAGFSQPFDDGFRVLQAVEDHHCPGLQLIHQAFCLQIRAPGGADGGALQRHCLRVVVQVMLAQDPAQGRQGQLSQRHALMDISRKPGMVQTLHVIGDFIVLLVTEHGVRQSVIHLPGELHTGGTEGLSAPSDRKQAGLQSLTAADEVDGYAGITQAGSSHPGISRIQTGAVEPGGGIEKQHRMLRAGKPCRGGPVYTAKPVRVGGIRESHGCMFPQFRKK